MTASTVTSPLVSVVIPAYKARNFLRESLASVAAQDYPNLEVWVIDDKSPEPIDDIVSDYRKNPAAPPLEVIRHETNQGLGAARNTGIRAARGEFVAFLDHDDLWQAPHISSVIQAIQNQLTDFGFCSVIQFKNEPEETLGTWGPTDSQLGSRLAYQLYLSNFITPSAVIIRRSSLLELEGFNTNPEIHMCEDLDLWLRALQHGLKYSFAKPATAFYRKHEGAATSRRGYMEFQSARVREIHFLNVPGSFFGKCSCVARLWWRAIRVLHSVGKLNMRIIVRAICWSLPAPWEIWRGLKHLHRMKKSLSSLPGCPPKKTY